VIVDDDAVTNGDAGAGADRPDFSGKVVVFYLANASRDSDSGVVMEYVEFRRFQGRWFLTGRVPEWIDFQWASRLQQAVAWDSVIQYLIFDSREDYERRLALGKPSLAQRLLNRGAS
jgi:hypothetical protein